MIRVRTHEKHSSVLISAALHLGIALLLTFAATTGEGRGAATLHVSWQDAPPTPQTFSRQHIRLQLDAPPKTEQRVQVQVSPSAAVPSVIPRLEAPVLIDPMPAVALANLPDLTTAVAGPAAVSGQSSEGESGGGGGETAGGGGAGGGEGTFFGHSITDKRIVFVLDCSGSMNSSSGVLKSSTADELPSHLSPAARQQLLHFNGISIYASRWERVVEELTSTLQPLSDDVEFSIILFSDGFLELEGSMQAAEAESKSKAVQWVSSFRARHNTYPFPALHRALQHSPEAIYFLTDGEFDATVIRQITLINNKLAYPAKIHSVGLGDIRDHIQLANLSRYNGGEFIAAQ